MSDEHRCYVCLNCGGMVSAAQVEQSLISTSNSQVVVGAAPRCLCRGGWGVEMMRVVDAPVPEAS